MLKLFFRSGLRSLLRFRQFSLINVIGLTLGFSAVMALAVMQVAGRCFISDRCDRWTRSRARSRALVTVRGRRM